MPITRSAKKALHQSIKKKSANILKKMAVKDVSKKIEKLIVSGSLEEAKKLVPVAYKAIDKAAKTGVFEKNTAARKKSLIARTVNKAKK